MEEEEKGGGGVGGGGAHAGGGGGALYKEEIPLSKALQRTLAHVKPESHPRTPSGESRDRDGERRTLNNLNMPQIYLSQAPSPIVPFSAQMFS